MKDLTILITASGSPSIPGFIKCMEKNGERKIRIIGTDMNEDPSINIMVDKFYQVPPVKADNYIEKILSICKKEKVDILIPMISMELIKIIEAKKKFNALGVKVSISNSGTLEIANNKLNLYKFMKKNKLLTPKFLELKDLSEIEEKCKLLGYPEKAVCIKITEGSGSRGVRIIDDNISKFDLFMNEKPNSFYVRLDEMISILSERQKLPELMLIEYLPGIEYSVDLLADNGEVLYIVGRRNTESLMSIAQESTLFKEPSAYQLCTDIVKMLKLDGNIGFDFIYDENGIPFLMDLNPRLTATMSVSAAGGINLPYLRLKQLLGEELPKLETNYGVKLKRRYHELFTDENGNEVIW